MTDRLLSAQEVAAMLGFAPGTIVDWAEEGKIPSFRIGGRLRFRPSELEAWLEKKRTGAGGEAPTAPRERPSRGVVSLAPTAPGQGGES